MQKMAPIRKRLTFSQEIIIRQGFHWSLNTPKKGWTGTTKDLAAKGILCTKYGPLETLNPCKYLIIFLELFLGSF
jgi:hypothetical protein